MAHDISLKEARERVGDVRKSMKAGADPIERKKTMQVEEAKTPSFGAFADELVGTLESGFPNESTSTNGNRRSETPIAVRSARSRST